MQTVFSPLRLKHVPASDALATRQAVAVDIPGRAESVLQAVRERGLGSVVPPADFSPRALRRVHDQGYLLFLETFWERWIEAGRDGEAFATTWPIRSLREDTLPDNIEGLLGRYSMDARTPMGPYVFEAASVSAATALTAAQMVLERSEPAAFGLCQAPGHHAGEDFLGGQCYLNNAAIAAQWMRDYGAARVAILDVGYHHGNGTQSIFYDRSDVLYLSLHADPRQAYPYFLGHSDETGEHAGTGFTRNWPLPAGTDWSNYAPALEEACRWLLVYRPEYLVISLGLDTSVNEATGGFRFTDDDFKRLGARIGRLELPTVFLLEDGQTTGGLGRNCVNVLHAYEEARRALAA